MLAGCTQQRQDALSQVRLKGLAGHNKIVPEADRVVIILIQSNPCDWRRTHIARVACRYPSAHQRRFAKASRCQHQRQLARDAIIQPRQQTLAGEQGSSWTRWGQFGHEERRLLEQRGRSRLRMLSVCRGRKVRLLCWLTLD